MSSMQHKLDRIRPPRVQITYDVETNGAMRKTELPFVVGVLSDLSGQPSEALKPLKERKAVQIDRDNFNDVLRKSNPRVTFKVPNRISNDGSKLAVELKFKSLEDFEPAGVAKQIQPLKELLDVRQRLTQLLSKMEGNDKLEALLGQIISNSETAKAMAAELGITTDTDTDTDAEPTDGGKG